MNWMIYCNKKNFDTQKAERFFKERRIPYTLVDVKKNPPGRREIELFLTRIRPEDLIDFERAYLPRREKYSSEERALAVDALTKDPSLIRYPIIRRGSDLIRGYDEKALTAAAGG